MIRIETLEIIEFRGNPKFGVSISKAAALALPVRTERVRAGSLTLSSLR